MPTPVDNPTKDISIVPYYRVMNPPRDQKTNEAQVLSDVKDIIGLYQVNRRRLE